MNLFNLYFMFLSLVRNHLGIGKVIKDKYKLISICLKKEINKIDNSKREDEWKIEIIF